MISKMCCSEIVVFLFLFCSLSACNTEIAGKDETSDPVLEEYPVVYIERDVIISLEEEPVETAAFPVNDPTVFNPGAQLFLKKNAFAESAVVNLTENLFPDMGKIDIRDLTVSERGDEFLVSIRAPEDPELDDDEQANWNIWRYQTNTKALTRVVVDDVIAEQGDDLMASYLPDGRILFASNRQQLAKAILLDEGKPQYKGELERANGAAFNIHIMQADGSDIKQLSYNLSHDFYPLVLQSGNILYSRWDAMGSVNKISFYQMKPDGTENHLVYGWHSQEITEQSSPQSPEQTITNNINYIKAQQLASGELFMLWPSSNSNAYQKRPVTLNINEYIDQYRRVATTDDDVNIDETNNSNSALNDLFNELNVNYSFSDNLSPAGRVNYIFPLPDLSQRFLLSLDLCRVVIEEQVRACKQLTEEELADENLTLAPPAYELWLFNQRENTQKLVAQPSQGAMITESAILQPSEINDEFIADKVIGNELDTELYNQQAGAIHIRSVYDFSGEDLSSAGIEQLKNPTLFTAEQRSARFIRLIRGVPMPSREVRQVLGTDFGRSRNQLMREILGYTPIQPDGSVKVKVPANIPFAISILDAQGKRTTQRHQQWITVKAGETLECNGCHTRNSEAPHGRPDAKLASINQGAISQTPFTGTTNEIIPEVGQTMAEAAESTYGLAALSSTLSYQDIWSNSNLSTPNVSTTSSYEQLTTAQPNGSQCFLQWNAYCRIEINYTEHIAPLWEFNRQVFNDLGELVQNNTCTSCHQPFDSDGLAQIPAGQLDLSNTPSSDQIRHLTSYRELFFNDVEQEIIEGVLVDRLIELTDEQGNTVYEVDSEGELLLDENNMPIARLTTIPVNNVMSPNGARASSRFFSVFDEVNHQNMLSPSEIKLLSEWLDIGAQYYNTPFYPLP